MTEQPHARPLLHPALWVFVAVVALIVYALPTLNFASRDLRMVGVFSLDEAAFAQTVERMHRTGTYDPGGFTYGALYPVLATFLVKIKSIVATVSESDYIHALRLLELVSAIALLAVTYRLGSVLLVPAAGAAAVAFLVTSPLLLGWSTQAHPDLLQLVFLTAGLVQVVRLARDGGLRSAAFSGVYAGLAMGTKYGGVFLVPPIVAAAALSIPSGEDGNRWAYLKSSSLYALLGVALLGFLGAFLVTNPYVLSRPGAFLADLSFLGRIVGDANRGGPLDWFVLLFTPGVGIALAVVGTIGLLRAAAGFRDLRAQGPALCLALYAIVYLLFLALRARVVMPHYLLPMLPALAVFAGASCVALSCRIQLKRIWALQIVILLAAVSQALPARGNRETRTADVTQNPVIEAGLWLTENVPHRTTILYDAYSYIPSEFQNARSFFGQSYPMIHLFRPELIVLRQSVWRRFADPDSSSHFRLTDDPRQAADFLYLDRQRYRDIHYTYRYFEEQRIPDYDVLKEFETARIYGLTTPDSTSTRHRDLFFAAVSAHESGGFPPGPAAEAYTRFGEVHLSAGNLAEAKVQFRKALGLNPNLTAAAYGLGMSLATQDSLGAAQSAFLTAAERAEDPAQVYIKMGWDLGQLGLFEPSRQVSMRAHELAPDHPYPLFNVALAYLSEGRAAEADSVYTLARARYGLPDETRKLMQQLLDTGRLPEEADQVLRRHLDVP